MHRETAQDNKQKLERAARELMMAQVREKMREIQDKLTSLPEAFARFDAVYQFCVEGPGGGSWLLSLKGVPSLHEGTGPATCTIRVQADDFVNMCEGRTDAQQLFFSGRLEVQGDFGLAVKLPKLFELLG